MSDFEHVGSKENGGSEREKGGEVTVMFNLERNVREHKQEIILPLVDGEFTHSLPFEVCLNEHGNVEVRFGLPATKSIFDQKMFAEEGERVSVPKKFYVQVKSPDLPLCDQEGEELKGVFEAQLGVIEYLSWHPQTHPTGFVAGGSNLKIEQGRLISDKKKVRFILSASITPQTQNFRNVTRF